MLNQILIQEIVNQIKNDDIQKIILFGSYAYGTSNQDSDLDLIVITTDKNLPNTYREKMQLQLNINRRLRSTLKKFPIDLIVYTQGMYQKFTEMGSMFSKEIVQKGVILYEKDNQRMA